jgi:hypothetical protein
MNPFPEQGRSDPAARGNACLAAPDHPEENELAQKSFSAG